MVKIFCDGAASNNGRDNAIGGYGWAMQIRNEKPILYGGRSINSTNNQMELTAMISALNYLQDIINKKEIELNENEEIYVYTDSAYIANCYSQKWYINWRANGWINSKKQPVLNKDMWELLIPYFLKDNIHIIKVKGHSDNSGNQLVDKIAVAARTLTNSEFIDYITNLNNSIEEL